MPDPVNQNRVKITQKGSLIPQLVSRKKTSRYRASIRPYLGDERR